ncbi:MAG TPA: glycosyltransferase [Candidatus Sabulitectum sp.]|nr:glycosyltransferase [Candidatus Sabulitectum sp.]
MKALLVTPLPPQPTGLADYARRIIRLTAGHVEWTVAYPAGAMPVPECRCVPISSLTDSDFQGTVVYQAGNSPHCSEVVRTLSARGGKVLFHETNLHHLLRQMAHETGEWSEYASHVKADYGRESDHVLKVMGRKAESLPEYDMRLRKYPLLGKLAGCATSIAVLSDTARYRLERLHPERKIVRMGFLADFLGRVQPPEPDGGPPIIGIAGTFHYGRNWEAMSQAVAELRKHHEVRLLAAGAGWPETGHGWIETTGRLSDMDFRHSIERFHIAIDMRHHTCSETSGSMMDVLRSGKPAVLSDEGSFRDIPACAVLRIPWESGAAGAFSALKYLMDNPGVARAIGQKAEEYFEGISDREKCLQQWMSFLEAEEE